MTLDVERFDAAVSTGQRYARRPRRRCPVRQCEADGLAVFIEPLFHVDESQLTLLILVCNILIRLNPGFNCFIPVSGGKVEVNRNAC